MSTNHFRIWVARMGFNQKQVSKAAGEIGIDSATTASQTFTGRRELTLAERLAMSAVRAGLQPWTPDYDDELMAGKQEPRPATAA
nr:hypothetical protein RNT25_01767 [arsenite-oxidising bacterium NT-25]